MLVDCHWASKVPSAHELSQGAHATCGVTVCEAVVDTSDEATVFLCFLCEHTGMPTPRQRWLHSTRASGAFTSEGGGGGGFGTDL